MRRVILHYHLFKNAGTSLDHVLRQNFWGRWTTAEFSMAAANTDEVAEWITRLPEMVAFSSHTMIGPLPQIDEVTITPVVLLRDPVERIFSAYRFERHQHADTFGARLAQGHDFAGYVDARLSRAGDRQCRNFQTARLASMIPGPGPELARAKEAARLIRDQGTLGLVGGFQQALSDLKRRIADRYPNFAPQQVHRNLTARSAEMPTELKQLLARENGDDIQLMAYASDMLAADRATA